MPPSPLTRAAAARRCARPTACSSTAAIRTGRASRTTPAQIAVPTLLIVGEWDADTPTYMARALDERLTKAPYKRLTIVPEGTHTVLLEKNRMRLFEEVQRFLDTGR